MKQIATAIIITLIAIFLLAGCSIREKTVPTGNIVGDNGDDEIVFGFSGGLTGSLAQFFVPLQDTTDMVVKEINNAGGIHGKKLKVLYEDDQCDPKVAVSVMQKFIEKDKVKAVIGPGCSGAVLAVAPLVEAGKTLLMSPGATHPDITHAGYYVFRTVNSDNEQGVVAAELAQKLNVKRVGLLYINNDWGVGLTKVFKEKAQELGMDVVIEETFEQGATDMRSQLVKVQNANVDLLYMPAYEKEIVPLLKQIKELGLDFIRLAAEAKTEAVLGAGNAAESLIVSTPGVVNSPEFTEFQTKFKSAFGKEPGMYTAETYDVVNILAKACKATDCSSSQMKDYLYAMGEYRGASGAYAFDKNGDVSKPYDFFVVEDGKWVVYKR